VPTHVQNFSSGLLVPGLAYTMSCVGALLGLLATSRARGEQGPARARWLVLGAVSIGGTGIWVMHFIAMLGFTVTGGEVRYDVATTLLSMVIAVGIVALGLFTIGFGPRNPAVLLFGGTVTGLGVAGMHYTGMAAVHVDGSVAYAPGLVALSILIAIGASTAALWAALYIRGRLATVGAALVMGVAVSGMHYTAMYAVSVALRPGAGVPHGLPAWDFLLPMIVGVGMLTILVLFIVVLSPTEHELLDERRREAGEARPAVPETPRTWSIFDAP
jgi:NO-binding membrane sensor protein with MHYT domain